MAIHIGFNEKMELVIGEPEKELCLTPDEERLIEIVIGFLSESVDVSMVGLEKRSNDYASMVYGGKNDFLRFKYTGRAKWVSLRLTNEILDELDESVANTLFAAQKNKNQAHWKSALSSLSDLNALKPYIIASCVP